MLLSLDKALEWLILNKLAPLMNKLPQKYKTLTGLLLTLIAWGFHEFPKYPWFNTAYEILIWAGPILTGVGVYHKAVAADPKEVGVN